jgi:hypothetical protein
MLLASSVGLGDFGSGFAGLDCNTEECWGGRAVRA